MHVIIFEVWPKTDRYDEYLEIAADLRSELEKMDGFISVERFKSITDDGKLLSLSFWRDEKAIQGWRQHAEHRQAQAKGRGGVFENYRLRVAEVARDYGMNDRDEAPADAIA